MTAVCRPVPCPTSRGVLSRAVTSAVVGLLAFGFAAPANVAVARNRARFGATASRYAFGEQVTLRLQNESDHSIRMGRVWTISKRNGDQAAFYVWPEAERTVAAGETRIWAWDQLAGGCYGACQNVAAGNQTEAGRYVVTTKAGGEAVSDNFDIGQYFTLGFDNEPDLTFVVFVANQADVDRLRTEANPTEKNLIVSGIVRGAADYNPAWSYSMGPHSIVAAEVFTEVCDQHPQQVESDRRQWRGQRWCPWSSYVDREGR